LERPNINPSHKLTHAVEKFNDIPIFTVAAEILKKKLVFDIAHYSRSCVCQVVYICNSPNFCLCPLSTNTLRSSCENRVKWVAWVRYCSKSPPPLTTVRLNFEWKTSDCSGTNSEQLQDTFLTLRPSEFCIF